jgi:hypothetical protein
VFLARVPNADRLHVAALVDHMLRETMPYAAAVAVGTAVTLLHVVAGIGLLGGTIGVRLVGCEIVCLKDASRPGFLRSVVLALSSAVTTALFFGPLYAFWVDRFYRGGGGLCARTVLVRRRRGPPREAADAR